MLNQTWRRWLTKLPKRRPADVRLSVETLEPRSLLAGLPLVLMFESNPAKGGPVDFGHGGSELSSCCGATASLVTVRGWTAQELAPRATVIVIIGNVPSHSPPVSPPISPPVNDRFEPGAGFGRPSGEPGLGRPGFGGFGSFGGRQDDSGPEGEPPDVAPIGNSSTSAPPSIPSRPQTPSIGTGLNSPTAPLGTPSSGNSSAASNQPAAGSNLGSSVSLPANNGSTLGPSSGSTSPLAPPNRPLTTSGAGEAPYLSAHTAIFSSAEVDVVRARWEYSRPDSSPSNSAGWVTTDRMSNMASPRTTVSSSGTDETEESPGKDEADDAGLETSTTGLRSGQSDRRDARAHRFVRGSRLRPAVDRDWLTTARPDEDAVDAILAALQRVSSESDAVVVADDGDEGGLVEVIVAAAADRAVME